MITVRPAEPADAEAMSTVLTASIRDLCAADHRNDPEILGHWLRNKSPPMVLRMFDNPNAQLLVAEHAGEVAAVGCVTDTGEVALNYVDPGHRFAGVSKALLAEMEQRLRTSGFTLARLTSTGTARRFYEAAGWRGSGPGEADRGMICYPMEKPL